MFTRIISKRFAKTLLFILAVFYACRCAKDGHDFEVFVYAGGKIIHNQNIYFPPFAQGLQYYYSPLFALILAPFSGLPIFIPQVLWIFLSYFLLYRIWILCAEYFDVSGFTYNQKAIWFIISLLLSIRFILIDVGYVQMTTFLLWASLQSLKWIRNGHIIYGAALLALAINIKLLPLPFVLYLLYRGQFKATAFTGLFYVLYLFIPALYLGWDKNMMLIHDWFSIINPVNKEWTIEAEDGPSSLVALIPVYLTKTVGVLTFRRNLWNLEFKQVFLILNIVRVLFVTATLIFLRTLPFKEITNKLRRFWELSYLFIIIPLIFPHQQQYAFLYISPAFVYIAWFFVANWNIVKQKLNIIAWLILGIVAFNFTPLIGRDIITSHFFEVLLYLRILPCAVILLIPVLWICRPQNTFFYS